ncbi:thiamine-phosphate diphosphorylase [Hahella sp. CCB-MM4]|uniref:thiamine phosphate synthase n=1 Tax=Hahella sp. (strain CCB-MM4) TaxID=1926491 RepID=UPI000B9AD4A3|nr:thiamine phosphate synthase [Hahella sp. CCB-MM4]OZG70041.1 thiamine-phosphate diphosphorylase [Hahella sp. CCB-MM4]
MTNPEFPPRGLYVITDSGLLPGDRLYQAVEEALLGGAEIVQYRNKESAPSQRLHEASRLQEICSRFGKPLIINDDVALAASCGAAGVHLGQSDGSVSEARNGLGERAIIGVTCHGRLDLAQRAAKEGASYLAFGRFFASHTKPNAIPADLSVIAAAKQSTGLPTVAIGGINLDNAPQVLQAGADFLAVIHGVFGQNDTQRRCEQFSTLFHS